MYIHIHVFQYIYIKTNKIFSSKTRYCHVLIGLLVLYDVQVIYIYLVRVVFLLIFICICWTQQTHQLTQTICVISSYMMCKGRTDAHHQCANCKHCPPHKTHTCANNHQMRTSSFYSYPYIHRHRIQPGTEMFRRFDAMYYRFDK